MTYERVSLAGERGIRYWAENTGGGTRYAATTENFPANLSLESSAPGMIAGVYSVLYNTFTELEGVRLLNEPPTSSPNLRKLTPKEEQQFLKQLKGK